MMLSKLKQEFGIESQNNIRNAGNKSIDGALACLETFYYSFNNRDIETFKKIWYDNDLIQLDNPLGGMVRGIKPIMEVYDKIFNGQAKVWVNFKDIICYATENMLVFTGTEIGEFTIHSETVPLKIRTSRIFVYLDNEESWFQLHHHGSIDNSRSLLQYQNAVKR